jgi:hypothetical protein
MKKELDDKSLDALIREELDNLEESKPKSSRTKDGKKVPGKYLTKDKAAMKGEIERVSKLKSDDPDAYGKWKADYKAKDTKGGKPHKTKKSAATIAYEKKFGNKKNENREMKELINEKTDAVIKNKAKASGISASILRQVYSRGAAAWKSGHRPGVSQQQWAAGRLNSFITGKGGARKADADLWARAKKSKKRKNESLEESELRRVVRSIITEMFDEKGVGNDADLAGPDVTKVLPYSDLMTAIAEKWGWDHDLTQQVSYALEIRNPNERERRIIALLNDYDVYDDFFPYLRMNEGEGLDELYPLMVGEENMEEGLGKYLAGAALAASLAGAPMKGSAQTPAKDFAKEKISMVKDKVGSLFNKKNTADLSQKGGGAEASIDSLNRMVGKIEKIGDNRFQTVGTATSDNLDMAMDLARSNGMNRIADGVKGKETSPGTRVASARLTDTRTKDERVFQNKDGSYTCFITVASFVN